MVYAIFGLIPMLITLLGVALGVVNILKRNTMFFFNIIICAVGCFAIEQLSLVINIWCGIMDDVWVGALGVFACNFFLLSANYGVIDTIVDENEFPTSKKILAMVVPIILGITTIAIFFLWKDYSLFSAIVFSVLIIPAIPASYLNVKHLLLEMDAMGILKATRPCDIMSLVVYFMTVVYLFAVTFLTSLGIGIAAIALAVSLLGLALAAVKGMKIWEILI